ncbi:hypothetical protein ACHAWU_002663 [Discostella pseudostelligera]|uniref:SURF1-like protein n=1 Tax=Discostella pseudostelligera TaxID=259834 RepID=A0ABD3MP02_9STRA
MMKIPTTASSCRPILHPRGYLIAWVEGHIISNATIRWASFGTWATTIPIPSSAAAASSHHHAAITTATAAAAVPAKYSANTASFLVLPSTMISHHYHCQQLRHHSASITAAAASVTAHNAKVVAGGGGGEGGGGGGDFGTAGKIFFSSLCLFTFSLGIWQTNRYFEKVSMVQKRKEDLKLVPFHNYYDWLASKTQKDEIENNKTTAAAAASNCKSYRRVHLRGSFIHEHEIFIGPRGPPPGALAESGPNSGRGGGGGGMSSSTQGYLVITPFVVLKDEEGDDASISSGTRGETKRGWLGSSRRSDGKHINHDSTNSSPSQKSTIDTSNHDVVWINRGWIPRHFLHPQNSHHHSLHPHHGPQPHNYNEIITSYTQPSGIQHILAMESSTDKQPGRFSFAPPSRVESSNHRVDSKLQTTIAGTETSTTNDAREEPPTSATTTTMSHKKLLWMDRPAMEELTSCPSDFHPPLFVEINTATTTDSSPQQSSSLQYPVKSSQEYVGEFKISPEIHAGYAVTWFGLSGAGMIMTRKLLSRGRL